MIRKMAGFACVCILVASGCGEDPVIPFGSETLISGSVATSDGTAIEGATISIRYQLSDTISNAESLFPRGPRSSRATSLDSLLGFSARQRGLSIELDWALDTLSLIDTFMVKRSIPESDTFETLFRLPATPPDTAYSYVDSVPVFPGTFRYRFFAELPGQGLSGDSISVGIPLYTQMGVPAPNPMVDSISVPLAFVASTSYRAEIQSTGGDLLALLDQGDAGAGEQRVFGWNGADSLGVRPPGGVHWLRAELTPHDGDPGVLLSPIFLNEGTDALTDSLGNYSIEHLDTGVLIRVVDSQGEVAGSEEVLQTIELTASAPGLASDSEDLTVLPNVNNKVDFTLVTE
ncbi:MAG: hypothetical protein CME06_00430 [Gemmatimonadetes bacterium]|nr:hypothetical protein [Gemmatimonadota bacterium]